MIEVYTDGSITKNPGGRGGFAWVLFDTDTNTVIQGGGVEEVSTNNRAELLGIINGLLQVNQSVNLYSDSKYSVNGYYQHWWNKNTDLWLELDKQVTRTQSQLIWIPRCSNVYAILADKLAGSFAFNHSTKPTLDNIINKINKAKSKNNTNLNL